MTDILAISAHPDDVEIAIGGTLLKMRRKGYSIAVCTATDGEPTPHGTHEKRLREAARAAQILDCEYEILDMPNRYLMDTVENRIKIANVIRKHRPSVILCPHTAGLHPDHTAVSKIVDAARFYAKFTRHDPAGNPWPYDPWWAPRQYYFFLGAAEEAIKPTFVVDISDIVEEKLDLLNSYESQWQVDMDFLSNASLWGRMIGARAGEAFWSKGPLGVDDFMVFTEALGKARTRTDVKEA